MIQKNMSLYLQTTFSGILRSSNPSKRQILHGHGTLRILTSKLETTESSAENTFRGKNHKIYSCCPMINVLAPKRCLALVFVHRQLLGGVGRR